MDPITKFALVGAAGHLGTLRPATSDRRRKQLATFATQLYNLSRVDPRILSRGSRDLPEPFACTALSDEQIAAINVRLYTPRIVGNIRLTLYVSAVTDTGGRGNKRWTGTVVDALTGQTFEVRTAACGLRCYCAAEVVDVEKLP